MRILVTAASRHGSTAEIAAELTKALRPALPTSVVDDRPMARVGSLDGYDAVVVGSAVHLGRWLAEARSWAGGQAVALRRRPVWLFSSGPVGDPVGSPTDAAVSPADSEELARTLGARDHRVFAGSLNRDRLGARERMVVGLVHASDGDFRDWPSVRAWAAEIAADLTVGSPAGGADRP